ncbi:MAG: Tim44/TimA family putative adaptor protein [Roseitalea porphyridii]|jgi:predicted lipid-binding transport protein (Tim44 family)|uniref:Tim44/TimA family putative adaptor protein n=1 Tax=Roseitalea porphyridii TaxID=1852022 RepID=UPI0032EFEDF9
MDTSNLVTLIFVVAAVFVFLQLRNVLGRRTGHERPPVDPYARRGDEVVRDEAGEADNVITLPGRGDNVEPYADIDKVAKPGTDVNKGLRAIRDAAPGFRPDEFLAGAKMAYEMIVMAFADGDRKTLRNLLSKEVYEGFEAALDEREARGETVQTNFVGIDTIEIVGAQMRGNEAHVTVSVVSQLVSATRDRDGEIIEGDPDAVAEVQDVWTFMRDVRSDSPDWKLEATEADE